MADKKVSELSAITTMADDDFLPIVDNSETTGKNKKVTVEQLKEHIGPKWTRFYFDKGSAPTGAISQSQYLGKNFGTWTEATYANSSTTGMAPFSADRDVTLTGVTFDSSLGVFKGFEPGLYQVHFNAVFKIDGNSSGSDIIYTHNLYAEMKNPAQFCSTANCSIVFPGNTGTQYEYTVEVSTLIPFERTVTNDNRLEFYCNDSVMNPNYYADYGYLDIVKIA